MSRVTRRTVLSLLASGAAPLPALADSMRIVETHVIAAYLNSLSFAKPQVKVLVIASRTAALEEAFVATQPDAKLIAADLPKATPAVIADFLHAAGVRTEIEIPSCLVRSGLEWRMAPDDSIERIFSDEGKPLGAAWDRFYKEYPRAAGITRISRVGIDKKSNQAMFFMSVTPGGLGGAGYFVLMHRHRGAWKVLASKLAWIS